MTAPILVTGGTGTLGRLVVARLRDTGCDVRVLSRRHHEPAQQGIEFVTGDLATGLGTPDVANLISDLSRRGSGEIPGNLRHGSDDHGHGNDHGKHHSFDPSK